MTVGRRRSPAAARPIVAALMVAVLLGNLGNLVAIGCVISWLRTPPSAGTSALLAAALIGQFLSGVAALLAWSWSWSR